MLMFLVMIDWSNFRHTSELVFTRTQHIFTECCYVLANSHIENCNCQCHHLTLLLMTKHIYTHIVLLYFQLVS